jgi:hypothetical protein
MKLSIELGTCKHCGLPFTKAACVAILIGYDDDSILYEIATTGKIPHISKRCALCGIQLNQEEQKRGACSSCHAEAVR